MSQKNTGTYFAAGLTQPVKWRGWSRAAFTLAARVDRPIFVNVGAAWSRWCAEMDRSVFSDGALAELLNNNFVCVRVDRDEWPNIDRLFQLAVGGGYPVNCVLTPDRRVVVAANYLPAHTTAGQPGLYELLRRVVELWSTDRPTLLKDSRPLEPATPQPAKPLQIGRALFEESVVKLLMDYDWELGGVDVNRPRRFPQPSVNRLLLAYSARSGDSLGVQASSITLRKMYYGGIMDQVGGGFHRLADAQLAVPSFEKLLLDNAELASNYAEQYQATGDEEFLDALNLTLDFMVRELWLGEGFASSLASDGEREGEYYTWTPAEVNEALGPELGRIGRQLFGVHPIAVSADPYTPKPEASGAVVAGRIVPRRMLDIEELAGALGVGVGDAWRVLGEIRGKMRAYRDARRRKPARDNAQYTHPNTLAAEALLAGYCATGLKRVEWFERALGVVGRLRVRVTRRLGGGREGLAEDYGGALNALISAYEVTGDPRLLDRAVSVGARLKEFLGAEGFSDERGGGVGVASMLDSPNESPNALAARGLLRLAALTGEEGVVVALRERLPVILGGVSRYRTHLVSSHLLNVDRLTSGPTRVVVVDAGDGGAGRLHAAALTLYHPFRVVERVLEGDLRDHPNPYVRSLAPTGASTAHVGVGFNTPFTHSAADPSRLAAHLRTLVPETYKY